MDNKFENLKQKLSKYWSKVGNKYSIITIVVVALLFYLVGVINIKPEVSKLENKYSIVKKENSKLEEEKEKLEKYAVILSILVDTFISKISLPMQPVPEIGSISGA